MTGEASLSKAPNSHGLGWAPDGRALIKLDAHPGCGSGYDRSGIYALLPAGTPELLYATGAYAVHGWGIYPND